MTEPGIPVDTIDIPIDMGTDTISTTATTETGIQTMTDMNHMIDHTITTIDMRGILKEV